MRVFVIYNFKECKYDISAFRLKEEEAILPKIFPDILLFYRQRSSYLLSLFHFVAISELKN
jgi:hypothetical protein